MARHDEKISADRAKMLSRGDTGDRLAEVDEVLGCLVVQTVEHHEAKLPAQRDPDLNRRWKTVPSHQPSGRKTTFFVVLL